MVALPVVRTSSLATAALLTTAALLSLAAPASAFVPPNKRIEPPRGDMIFIAATSFKFLKEAKYTGTGGMAGYGGGDPNGFAVTVNAFYIDRTEVTAGAYAACVQAGACPALDQGDTFSPKYTMICTYGKAGLERHPLNCVTHDEAIKFCSFVGKRLPSEAEWELAARGVTARAFPWGDVSPEPRHMNGADASLVAAGNTKFNPPETFTSMWSGQNDDDGWAFTAPVGSYPEGASPYGVLDLSGNVEEWMSDNWWEITGSGPPMSKPNPAMSGGEFVVRGGAWDLNGPDNFTSTHRTPSNSGTRAAWLGFRCARDA